jgi:hypothetical protein
MLSELRASAMVGRIWRVLEDQASKAPRVSSRNRLLAAAGTSRSMLNGFAAYLRPGASPAG